MYEFELDDVTRSMLERVTPYTMTSAERLASLKDSIDYVVRCAIPGDIVECGVWKGGSMMLAAFALLGLGETRVLWLYDTFSGMPAPGLEDRHWSGGGVGVPVGAWSVDPDEVKANMAATGYDMRFVRCVAGPVEETLPNLSPSSIAILRLDTDWYASTKHELTHLFPRLSRGGVMIIDDYGHWLGAKKATDEFVATLKEPLMLHRIDYTGRIAIRQSRP